jgi:hypothetical protein
MSNTADVRLQAQEALEKIWFIQSAQETERTDVTLSLRLIIRPTLFVQVFAGDETGSLYFALILNGQRVFGIDRINDKWHVHPYKSPDEHVLIAEGMGPKPLLKFLASVEDLLVENSLL